MTDSSTQIADQSPEINAPNVRNHHPDVRLRLHNTEIHLGYDGSVRVGTNVELIGRDGISMEQRHNYSHRLAPNEWHGMTMAQAIHRAFKAHHEHLGLNDPDDLTQVPLHLHPRGYPGTTAYAPVPPAPIVEEFSDDHEQWLKEHIDHAKYSEGYSHSTRGGAISPLDHPSTRPQPGPRPTPSDNDAETVPVPPTTSTEPQ